jgi:hypothetical protein
MKRNPNLQWHRDFDNRDGGVVMENPMTIDRYHQLREYENTRDVTVLGLFFAFNKQQFAEGLAECQAVGSIKRDDKIWAFGAGCYGTESAWLALGKAHKNVNRAIAAECDPQEIYLYEYNNYECMFGGDEPAMRKIIDIFGIKAAQRIKRIDAYATIEDIAANDD